MVKPLKAIGFCLAGLLLCAGCQNAVPAAEADTTSTAPRETTVQTTAATSTATESTAAAPEKQWVVVLDPGHQAHGNAEKEPVGPGSTETKARVASGTSGKTSGLNEYELNLMIGLALRTELESRGYTVYMTRETHDVDMSNKERAEFASACGGDILVRIHANGDTNTETRGSLTICQTKDSPYQDQYEASYALSEAILDAYTEATGIQKQYIWETDTMTGTNWCSIPNTVLEMGYMSNPEEDALMADPEFQPIMVKGIADGIDAYFEKQ